MGHVWQVLLEHVFVIWYVYIYIYIYIYICVFFVTCSRMVAMCFQIVACAYTQCEQKTCCVVAQIMILRVFFVLYVDIPSSFHILRMSGACFQIVICAYTCCGQQTCVVVAQTTFLTFLSFLLWKLPRGFIFVEVQQKGFNCIVFQSDHHTHHLFWIAHIKNMFLATLLGSVCNLRICYDGTRFDGFTNKGALTIAHRLIMLVHQIFAFVVHRWCSGCSMVTTFMDVNSNKLINESWSSGLWVLRIMRTTNFSISGLAKKSFSKSGSAYCNACTGENLKHWLWIVQYSLVHWPNLGKRNFVPTLSEWATGCCKLVSCFFKSHKLRTSLACPAANSDCFPVCGGPNSHFCLRVRRGPHKLPTSFNLGCTGTLQWLVCPR